MVLASGHERLPETNFNDETFAFGMQYHRVPQVLVQFGKCRPGFASNGYPQQRPLCGFQLGCLLNTVRKHKIEYQELNKFFTVRRIWHWLLIIR